MKLLILLFTFYSPLFTQQKLTTHTLTTSAGSIHCTFTNHSPAALTGLHIECRTPTSSIKLDTVLTPIGTSATILSDRDSLTYTFALPAPGAALYKINANGKIETGSL